MGGLPVGSPEGTRCDKPGNVPAKCPPFLIASALLFLRNVLRHALREPKDGFCRRAQSPGLGFREAGATVALIPIIALSASAPANRHRRRGGCACSRFTPPLPVAELGIIPCAQAHAVSCVLSISFPRNVSGTFHA